MSKRYDRRISIPLTETEYARLEAAAKRSGYSPTDYRRMALLSGPPQPAHRWEEYCWEADTLENIRSDVRQLLRQLLHCGEVDTAELLALMERLRPFEERHEEAEKVWRT